MSFVSSVVIKVLDEALKEVAPEIEQFIMASLCKIGKSLVEYTEDKIGVDLDGNEIGRAHV